MFQNGWLAAVEVALKCRNLPIVRVDNITRHKVMDVIMNFEATYELGSPLRDEFFPGDLRQEEIKWWQADKRPYDEAREKKIDSCQWPRSNENCAECVRVRESLAKSKCVPLCPKHAVQSRSMRK
ncbi:hypothetical protein MN608_11687 [Microdochium nivale]|nr:hypothetical protein MN608_11687 [Microdochium nivale]